MSSPYDLVVKPVSVTAAGVTADFSAIGKMGSVTLVNLGPDPVFFSFDATPPSAAVQAGVIELDNAGICPVFNWDEMAFKNIQFITGGGKTATVQIVAAQNDGSSSGFNG